jgi:hypothetical protein
MEGKKRRIHGRLEPNGYPFFPFAVESYGLLGKEAEEAGRRVSKSGFVASAIRELSVGLCRGNDYMYRAAWGLLAQVTGQGFRAGADRPTDEVV